MQIHDVEQGTGEWYQLRAGLATASEFSKLVTPTGKPSKSVTSYANLLAVETLLNRPAEQFNGNWATERGNELEPEARLYYALTTSQRVKEVGFITNDGKTAGCSPDSIVGDDGLLEIKCPLEQKFVDCFSYVYEGECPPDYHIQIQAQMFISGRSWCDLLLFHPDLPKKPVRILPDKELHAVFEGQMQVLLSQKAAMLAKLTEQKEAA